MTDEDRVKADVWLAGHGGDLPPDVLARVTEFRECLRQARACLLNLMPDDRSPMARQMGKMVDEINAVWP